MDLTVLKTSKDYVSLYAKAAMERNGRLQYALFSKSLQQQVRAEFEGLSWVTGTSSPWVIGYDIAKEDDLHYTITFHYATSTGPASDVAEKIVLESDHGIYAIKTVN